MEITDTDKIQRVKILRRRAAIVQRLNIANDNQQFGKIAHLCDELEECKTEIKKYGGAPKNW
jgi:hypothetical protein